MKMYTSNQQTTKLIELGFDKPTMKNIPTSEGEVNEEWYSIGELIEMLPIELEDVGINTTLTMHFDHNIANVEYIGVFGIEYSIMKEELIDALYDMILKLKKKGVI